MLNVLSKYKIVSHTIKMLPHNGDTTILNIEESNILNAINDFIENIITHDNFRKYEFYFKPNTNYSLILIEKILEKVRYTRKHMKYFEAMGMLSITIFYMHYSIIRIDIYEMNNDDIFRIKDRDIIHKYMYGINNYKNLFFCDFFNEIMGCINNIVSVNSLFNDIVHSNNIYSIDYNIAKLHPDMKRIYFHYISVNVFEILKNNQQVEELSLHLPEISDDLLYLIHKSQNLHTLVLSNGTLHLSKILNVEPDKTNLKKIIVNYSYSPLFNPFIILDLMYKNKLIDVIDIEGDVLSVNTCRFRANHGESIIINKVRSQYGNHKILGLYCGHIRKYNETLEYKLSDKL